MLMFSSSTPQFSYQMLVKVNRVGKYSGHELASSKECHTPPEKWTYPLKRDHFKGKIHLPNHHLSGHMFSFLGYIYHPSQGASHKWRFRLGFPILKLECYPGWVVIPSHFLPGEIPGKKNAIDLHQVWIAFKVGHLRITLSGITSMDVFHRDAQKGHIWKEIYTFSKAHHFQYPWYI